MSTNNSYDAVPYPSNPFRQTHPNRLATLAKLFGLNPADITKCRLLEIGCAGGGNIVPMGEQLPSAELVGIDLSEQHIKAAREFVQTAGLENIQLHQKNIMDVDAGLGKFDFIICHGVYSWVPNDVRNQIFSICDELLTENGVAYISYNTYPGWHMRGMIREMMRYHTQQFEEPETRTKQARGILEFLATNAPAKTPYGQVLRREAVGLQNHSDSYLYHDHLEDVNEPCYFYQFVNLARKHNLEYLGEAEMSSMYHGHFPQQVTTTVDRVTSDLIQTEQYLDFVRNRTFRQTLLCRQHQPVNRLLSPESLKGFYIACALGPTKETAQNLNTNREVEFMHPSNNFRMRTDSPLVKAALANLSAEWPQAIEFEQLLHNAQRHVSGEGVIGASENERTLVSLGKTILECYVSDLAEIRAHPMPFSVKVSERPRASSVAIAQAENGVERITNLRHEMCAVNEFSRKVLSLLDGNRSREDCLSALVEMVRTGEIVIQGSDASLTSDLSQKSLDNLSKSLDKSLKYLARVGLLLEPSRSERTEVVIS